MADHDATAEAQAQLERAEQLFERTRDRSARFLLRTFARAREEAEDIWAEARTLSTSSRP